jgi:REP element-mobilizing transposase RayT
MTQPRAKKPVSARKVNSKADAAAHAPRQSSLFIVLPVGSPERARLKDRLQPRTTHGGDPAKGKRKTERPFATTAPLHLVLKSSRARKDWSMLHRRHRSKVTSMIYVYAKRFRVHVYRATNVGNHLHLLVRAKDRKDLADYLRVLAGRVAVTVTGARKGVKRIGKFWDALTWSRLVNWGRDFFGVRDYLAHAFQIQGWSPKVAAKVRASEADGELSWFLGGSGAPPEPA